MKPNNDRLQARWRDPDEEAPPKGVKLNLLSKYGVASYGTFVEGFHVGWDYCMKIPPSIKEKLKGFSK